MEDPYLAEILSKALNKDKTPEKSAKEEPLSSVGVIYLNESPIF